MKKSYLPPMYYSDFLQFPLTMEKANRGPMKSKNILIIFIILLLPYSVVFANNNHEAPYSIAIKAYKEKNYSTAIKQFETAAIKGDTESQYYLGVIYDNGYGVKRDADAAIKWWQIASENGHAKSQYNLAMIYYTDKGHKNNHKKILNWLRESSDQGNIKAKNNLGVLSMDFGKPYSISERSKTMKLLSAISGSSLGIVDFNIAEIYLNDHRIDNHVKKAVPYYKKAVKHGHKYAQSRLGHMYLFGIGVPQNYKKAIKLLRSAAQHEVPDAQFRMGAIYEYGIGVKRNYREAIKWYSLAEDFGYKDALDYLVITKYKLADELYLSHKNNDSYKEAFNLYQFAAKNDYGKAFIKIAYMYENGLGIKQDYKKAFRWYERAASKGKGNACAEYKKGYLTEKGLGVKQSNYAAFGYYKKATVRKSKTPSAGYLQEFDNGYDVPFDFILAVNRYIDDADKGDKVSQYNLAEMYYRGWGVEESEQKAIELLTASANQGYIPAQIRLGEIFKHSDVHKAIDWLKLASAKGSYRAMYLLGLIHNNDYRNGIFDRKKHYSLMKKAAKGGYKPAIFELAQAYASGHAVDQDYAKAAALHRELTYNICEEEGLKHSEINSLPKRDFSHKSKGKKKKAHTQNRNKFTSSSEAIGKGYLSKAEEQAYSYEKGFGVKANTDKALELYFKEAKDKSDFSIRRLLWFAKQGNIEAQYLIASLYGYGRIFGYDNKRIAIEWYTKAAVQGHIESQLKLGSQYQHSNYGIDKNLILSAKWYQMALKGGEDEHALGYMLSFVKYRELYDAYLYGKEDQENKSGGELYYSKALIARNTGLGRTAYKLLLIAANDGYIPAQYDLAMRYQILDSLEWLEKIVAEKRGLSAIQLRKVMYRLGEYYRKYKHEKYAEAVKLFRQSASLGSPEAQTKLGDMYRDGEYFRYNETEFFKWYTKAAKQGYAEAETKLGICYETGYGTDIDLKKAVALYTKAMNADNAHAKYRLVFLYIKGQGVKKDLEKAKKLLREAAKEIPDAREMLKKMHQIDNSW